MAGGRSRRRSTGKLRDQATGSKSSVEISQKNHERLWSATRHRDRSTAVLRGCDESYWQLRLPGDRSLAEQSSRKFSPAFSTKRASHAPFPTGANLAEIRFRPRLRFQPLQPGTQPLQQTSLQAQPRRRSCRVARSLRGINRSVTVLVETSSHPSDSTLWCVRFLIYQWLKPDFAECERAAGRPEILS